MVKKGFYEKFAELKPDILCLQETKAQNGDVEAIAAGMDTSLHPVSYQYIL